MKLAIIHNGIVYEVLDEIEQFNLDKPMARSEVGIAIALKVGEIERSQPPVGTVQVVKEVFRGVREVPNE